MGKMLTATASANTEVVLTIAAGGAEVKQVIESFGVSFSAAPATARLLTIESPSGDVLHRFYVTAAGLGPMGAAGSGYEGIAGQALIIRLAADSGGAIGCINAVQRNH